MSPPKSTDRLPFVRATFQKEAKHALDVATAEAKECYDKKHTPIDFFPGDMVYINLKKGTQPGYTLSTHHGKYGPRREGPFEVVERVGLLSYRLKLPKNLKNHDVVSVTNLTLASRALTQCEAYDDKKDRKEQHHKNQNPSSV